MARIRTIKPEFFSHEELASKSPHARLLALGLLTLADCEGRLRWVPMQVHSQVFPWEAEVKIEVLLGELISVGYVFHYETDGKRYVQVVNFTKHQRITGKEASYRSRLPAPPKKDPSEPTKHRDLPSENGETLGKHPGTSQGNSGKPLGTGEQGNQRNRGTEDKDMSVSETESGRKVYSDEFETFWTNYPRQRRSKKGDAYRKWKAAIKNTTPERLIARCKDYAASNLGRGEFACMPSVWLSGEMWLDAPEAWSSISGSKQTLPPKPILSFRDANA